MSDNKRKLWMAKPLTATLSPLRGAGEERVRV